VRDAVFAGEVEPAVGGDLGRREGVRAAEEIADRRRGMADVGVDKLAGGLEADGRGQIGGQFGGRGFRGRLCRRRRRLAETRGEECGEHRISFIEKEIWLGPSC
jgi:hypothetical protein